MRNLYHAEVYEGSCTENEIIIPSELRQLFSSQDFKRIYLTRGLDRCLFLFTGNEWEAGRKKFLSLFSETSDKERMLKLFYSSQPLELKKGRCDRIPLSDYLKEYADIEHDMVWIPASGPSRKIEIWAKERWLDHLKSRSFSGDSIDPGSALNPQ